MSGAENYYFECLRETSSAGTHIHTHNLFSERMLRGEEQLDIPVNEEEIDIPGSESSGYESTESESDPQSPRDILTAYYNKTFRNAPHYVKSTSLSTSEYLTSRLIEADALLSSHASTVQNLNAHDFSSFGDEGVEIDRSAVGYVRNKDCSVKNGVEILFGWQWKLACKLFYFLSHL